MIPFEAHFTLDTFPLSILFASDTQSILIAIYEMQNFPHALFGMRDFDIKTEMKADLRCCRDVCFL